MISPNRAATPWPTRPGELETGCARPGPCSACQALRPPSLAPAKPCACQAPRRLGLPAAADCDQARAACTGTFGLAMVRLTRADRNTISVTVEM